MFVRVFDMDCVIFSTDGSWCVKAVCGCVAGCGSLVSCGVANYCIEASNEESWRDFLLNDGCIYR